MTPLDLLDPLGSGKPIHAVLGVLLDIRLEPRLEQVEVVHRPDPADVEPGEPRPDPIHAGPARLAEVVGHVVPVGHRLTG